MTFALKRQHVAQTRAQARGDAAEDLVETVHASAAFAAACPGAHFRRSYPKRINKFVGGRPVLTPVTEQGPDFWGWIRTAAGLTPALVEVKYVNTSVETKLDFDRFTAAELRDLGLCRREGGVAVERGRVFVLGVAAAPTALDLGDATALIRGADVGVDRGGAASHLYVANGEITVRSEPGVGGIFPPEPRGDHGIARLHQRRGLLVPHFRQRGDKSIQVRFFVVLVFIVSVVAVRRVGFQIVGRACRQWTRTENAHEEEEFFVRRPVQAGPDVFRQIAFQRSDVETDFSRRHGLIDVHPITLLEIVHGG